jgi:hypothetical protein
MGQSSRATHAAAAAAAGAASQCSLNKAAVTEQLVFERRISQFNIQLRLYIN